MGNINQLGQTQESGLKKLSTPYGKHKRDSPIENRLWRATFYSLWET